MSEIKLRLNEKRHGAFYVIEEGKQLGEMVIGISDTHITAYHTEVEVEGKGLGKQLLDALVNYAREHQLKVTALCPYVHAQFERHPEQYADIWERNPTEE